MNGQTKRLSVLIHSKKVQKLQLCILLVRTYSGNCFAGSTKAEHTYTLWPKKYMPTETYAYVHSTEMCIYAHKKTCIGIFLVALFIIAKNWKQLQCSSIIE